MRYIVDQIHETLVTCELEDKTLVTFARDCFPKELQVGDMVTEEGGKFVILAMETMSRREQIQTLMDSLWE